MLADGGASEFEAVHVIVTLALPDFEPSAILVAVTLTVGGDGTTAGAMYEALAGPFAAIVPSVAFPPATSFTLHATVVTGLPVAVMLALNT